MTPVGASSLHVGDVLEITFQAFRPRITLKSERALTVEIVAGDNAGFGDTVEYEPLAVRDGVVILSWQSTSAVRLCTYSTCL